MSDFRFPLSERALAQLWQDQTFPAEALTTTAGERLRVVYRGRRTGGPGPDFRDALIAAPGGLLRGDVELHVRSSDFRRHGHHLDGAYAAVVLHLVFADDEAGETALPGGGEARVVSLGAWVDGRAQEIERWLERPALWREPCFSALSRQGAAAVAATLDRLGDMRFRARAAAFARQDSGADAEAVLWQALLEALAFGGDREGFRELARRVPWATLSAELRMLQPGERTGAAHGRLAARDAMTGTGRPARPGNRAEDRLRGAAALAARFADRGLLDALEAAVHRAEGNAPGAVIRLLTVPGLVGRPRALELLANAVLPLLASLGKEPLARRAEALYQALPLSARYGAVRHLHHAVAQQSKSENGKSKTERELELSAVSSFELRGRGAMGGSGAGVRVDFRRQQGMLYLLKQYCTQGGCGRCPLS
jgi:hypothetical protein